MMSSLFKIVQISFKGNGDMLGKILEILNFQSLLKATEKNCCKLNSHKGELISKLQLIKELIVI